MVFVAGKTVWSMSERFKVVSIPCKALYKCSAFARLYAVCTNSSYGDSSFVAAGPRPWNRLPPNMRHRDLSYEQFRLKLQTLFLGDRQHGALWRPWRTLTYLLTYLLKLRIRSYTLIMLTRTRHNHVLYFKKLELYFWTRLLESRF